MTGYNILAVDDDKAITEAIEIYLTNEGYKVFKAQDGVEALKVIEVEEIHLVLMDIMMPNMDGTRATLKIREVLEIPIIMLSAKSEDTDKILGLNLGADDYVTKPFNPLELIARVNSQIRRYTKFSPLKEREKEEVVIGSLSLNKLSKEVFVDETKVKLTSLEFKILTLLMENPGRVFSIEEIYERVWNEVAYNVDTVTVHIRRIREKIEINPKEPRYLKVVWGIGYKIEKQG
jgi:DNA-binding response OmpR family regulator